MANVGSEIGDFVGGLFTPIVGLGNQVLGGVTGAASGLLGTTKVTETTDKTGGRSTGTIVIAVLAVVTVITVGIVLLRGGKS